MAAFVLDAGIERIQRHRLFATEAIRPFTSVFGEVDLATSRVADHAVGTPIFGIALLQDNLLQTALDGRVEQKCVIPISLFDEPVAPQPSRTAQIENTRACSDAIK